jgi:ABC-type bacteriocin/lantibiotic exporter with double-glycine peptidase domain
VLAEEGIPNAARMVATAQKLGVRSRGVRVRADQIHLLDRGSILHWNGNHFVALDGFTDGGVNIIDRGLGRRRSLSERSLI